MSEIKGYTESSTINEGFARLLKLWPEKKVRRYFTQVDKMFNPNQVTVIEYRHNGVVMIDANNRYIFHALAGMDLKVWRVAFVRDITDQFDTQSVKSSESMVSK
jgi:hypothetical protein